METIAKGQDAPARPVRKQGGYKQKRGGKRGWLKRLLAAGQLAKAADYAKRHGIPLPPPPAPPAGPGSAATVASAPAPADPTAGASAFGGSAGPAPSVGFANHGGEGVSQAAGRENWDKTTQELQISQCSPLATADAVPLAVEADLTRLAAKAVYTPTVTPPTGESEGERGFGQAQTISVADGEGVREEVVSVWPKVGEGIVGKLCRNKQYNELRVEGEGGREMWTKVGNWMFRMGLIRGERVLVRKVWGSADDTDAEYVVVRRLDVNEPATEEPVVVEQEAVVAPIEDVVVATPPSAVSEKETTAGVLPQFQREEPDFPRTPESGEDYIARIRAEAAMWANGQGR
jgi:hypothetical protein